MSVSFTDKKDHNCIHYDPYDISNVEQALPLLDQLKNYGRNDGLVKGVVRTFENGNLIDECIENLVVANGRKYVAQRLFGTRHPSDAPVYDWNISHFGIGSGGASISGANVNLIGPEVCDLDLNIPIAQSGNPPSGQHLSSPGDSERGIVSVEYAVKAIEPSGLIDIIISDGLNCQYGPVFSYVRSVCVKSIGTPNYLNSDNDYIMINESALYISNDIETQLFAHICFGPKYVEKKSEFVIEWYILC